MTWEICSTLNQVLYINHLITSCKEANHRLLPVDSSSYGHVMVHVIKACYTMHTYSKPRVCYDLQAPCMMHHEYEFFRVWNRAVARSVRLVWLLSIVYLVYQ